MAASAHSGALTATVADDAARRGLCQMVATYGLGICTDPWRCEALLRDLCGGHRREIFWLIAALKENVIADLRGSLDGASDAILLARVAHKLAENLGLAAAPAQWTAESWLAAVRCAPASVPSPDLTLASRAPLPAWPPADAPDLSGLLALPPGIDWLWLSLCVAGCATALLTIGVVLRVALIHSGAGPRGWFIDTAILAIGLGAAALGEYGLARALATRRPRRRPAPAEAPWALTPEVLALLLQPLALVAVPVLWIGEWYGQWHLTGQAHDFAFHLGRALQSLLVGAFLWKWWGWMTAIQGRVATTLVRPR